MTTTIKASIFRLLDEGKTANEIIKLGITKSSFYAAQRQWRRQKEKPPPAVAAGTAAAASNQDQHTRPAGTDIECDPEVLDLKKRIRISELRGQLTMTTVPPDMPALLAAARILGKSRRDCCALRKDGVCTARVWPSRDKIPDSIGEPVPADEGGWYTKPQPVWCALCIAGLETAIADMPLRGLRSGFTCSCGAAGMVGVTVKCTVCGREKCWGWHPRKS